MNLETNAHGDLPRVASDAFVHPSAVLIGAVLVEAGVFIAPQAVLRADEPGPDGRVVPIRIGRYANIQDGVVIHALGGSGVEIGPRSSIAHGAVVHGPCKIGENCFIGFRSVVFDATLGPHVIVMHQALVEGVIIPDGLVVPSMTAVRTDQDVHRLNPARPEQLAFAAKVAQVNSWLAQAALDRLRSKTASL